jgi:hypothetical protein
MSSDEPDSRRYESTILLVIDDVLDLVMVGPPSIPYVCFGIRSLLISHGLLLRLWRQVMILDLSYSPL